jgi:hypothetical protein
MRPTGTIVETSSFDDQVSHRLNRRFVSERPASVSPCRNDDPVNVLSPPQISSGSMKRGIQIIPLTVDNSSHFWLFHGTLRPKLRHCRLSVAPVR